MFLTGNGDAAGRIRVLSAALVSGILSIRSFIVTRIRSFEMGRSLKVYRTVRADETKNRVRHDYQLVIEIGRASCRERV